MRCSILDHFRACLVLWAFLLAISTAFQITGVSGGVNSVTGERPFRQEINQLAVSGPAFDLFILSLRQLQSRNQSNLLSYFQIAGIHGFPQIPWDGVAGTGGYPGYCTHAAVPFPTWHRPYLVLYEQALWNNAQIIARTYPLSQQDEYKSAALTIRIPYWDWAAHPGLPDVVAMPTISINTPDGIVAVDNPLYNYTFQSSPHGNGFPSGSQIAEFPWTVRQWNGALQQSNQSASNASLLSQAPGILAITYQILTSVTDYTLFSCTNAGGRDNGANNIENIHNAIHNSVGGWGHMTYPEVAAFDPIFFLHHANVDRLFAIWQALNPSSYIEPTLNTYGSYYELAGFVDSGNTTLAPFHSDNGTTMYTSDAVRDIGRFGYSYPEIIDWNISASDLAANIRTKVNQLYNPGAFSTRPSKSKTVTINDGVAPRAPDIAQAFSHVTFDYARNLGVNNMDMQWSAIVRLQRFAYSSAFAIDVFMGDPPKSPKSWPTAPNLVGSYAQFISSNVTLMHPNGVPAGLVHGELSLTHTLTAGVARGHFRDLSPRSVVPCLTEHLTWRARTPDGSEISIDSIRGLSISIGSRNVQPATFGSEFPKYGDMKWYPEVTRNKAGGSRRFHGPHHGRIDQQA